MRPIGFAEAVETRYLVDDQTRRTCLVGTLSIALRPAEHGNSACHGPGGYIDSPTRPITTSARKDGFCFTTFPNRSVARISFVPSPREEPTA